MDSARRLELLCVVVVCLERRCSPNVVLERLLGLQVKGEELVEVAAAASALLFDQLEVEYGGRWAAEARERARALVAGVGSEQG